MKKILLLLVILAALASCESPSQLVPVRVIQVEDSVLKVTHREYSDMVFYVKRKNFPVNKGEIITVRQCDILHYQ